MLKHILIASAFALTIPAVAQAESRWTNSHCVGECAMVAPSHIVEALKKRFPDLDEKDDITLGFETQPPQVTFYRSSGWHMSCFVILGPSVKIGKCRTIHA